MPPQPLGNRLPAIGNTVWETLYTQTVSGLIPYRDVGTNTTTNYGMSEFANVSALGITWTVFQRPIEASTERIGQFAALFPHNGRPLQNRNGRLIVEAR